MKKKSDADEQNLKDTTLDDNGIVESEKKKNTLFGEIIIMIVFVVLGALVMIFNGDIRTYIEDAIICESYGNSIWNECHNLKVFGSDYCKEHICALEECKNERFRSFDYDYPYCKEHSCSIGLLPMYDAEDCYNFADGGGAYCAEHTCCDEDCDNPVFVKDDGYTCSCCAAHMCMYKYDMSTEDLYKGFYCYSYKDGGGYYCSDHTCSKKDCTDEVYSNKYCRKHYFDANR